ncbi:MULTISPECIES: GNAT family N-acetyltransferase [unclassified Arthrobacter]|uniref:GNAT family N-acetyltransferase n=1 Tax=unclassified Arthrobacter TaxID=235627 RepID=UPI00159D411C|nr:MULTISPECIES: GNAT family N-acetyltransferase [unclassified Arthrobacter]MCQ9164345.1 GNAT family N-acetyltransferase [Arthrobacter sp. STN4]NVM97889.1 GNAT family N-acetyltransferase [Arthrobacter sp. SDTb3-6]
MVTLADCERTQHAWFRAQAAATGGRAFGTHRMDWVWLPETREMLCLFPTEITEAGLLPALAEAERRGAAVVGVWLNAAVKPGELERRRFGRGWQPWWMTVPLDPERQAAGGDAPDGRVRLDAPAEGVCALDPPQAWRATAHVGDEWAGQSYVFVPPEQGGKHLAGIFDMYVAPEHRRTGLGTALLDRLSQAAADAGAEHLLLNATPEGLELYRNRGFQLIGKGRTWWYHLPA